jgi:molybdopterin biosynthesis enzyme MoaB
VFDYLDGGAEGEITLRENCRTFKDVTFRPRHAVEVADCDLCTRVLGLDLSLPFLLAPVGYSRLMHPGGEVAAAREAGKAGTGYILSTISGHRLEDVKAGSSGPVFYQLYLMGGRAAAEAVIERARVAGFAGLVVTTGGTGFGPRDLTPEATRQVLEREAPGFAEAMRLANPDKGRLSRGVAGTRGRCIILNTPGSSAGAVECLEAVLDVLPHALALLEGRPTSLPQ